MSRIQRAEILAGDELFEKWTSLYGSFEAAVAHAIWVANRLVKGRSLNERVEFYSLKEHWLRKNQDFLVSGHISREEIKYCYSCNGSGLCNCDNGIWYDHVCNRCYGSGRCERCEEGIYSEKTLYEHRLLIADQQYSFHSYQEPQFLSEAMGEDCIHYGERFSEGELAELPLLFPELMQMLRFVAEHIWELEYTEWLERWQ